MLTHFLAMSELGLSQWGKLSVRFSLIGWPYSAKDTVETLYDTIGGVQEIWSCSRRILMEYHDLDYFFHDGDHIAQRPDERKF